MDSSARSPKHKTLSPSCFLHSHSRSSLAGPIRIPIDENRYKSLMTTPLAIIILSFSIVFLCSCAPKVEGTTQTTPRSDSSVNSGHKVNNIVAHKGNSSGYLTPQGKPISHVFVLYYSRPRELDGWPFTAYIAEEEKQYWVHEGGGISGINRWFGPFALP